MLFNLNRRPTAAPPRRPASFRSHLSPRTFPAAGCPARRSASALQKTSDIDRGKFTTVAHRRHAFCCPLGDAKADRLVGLLELAEAARVLDVGCVKTELLLRTIARYGCAGTGIDTSAAFLEKARRNAEARGLAGRVNLHEAEAEAFPAFPLKPSGYDAALCVGASHAFGTPPQALPALAALVRPDGLALFGEG